ncbi:hypothetical protein GE107_25580 [Cohnella sp. CFH 77786]|uniref:hypothetical protein n=1 Tax=Cohnella sp. CFH 77786 TaxID=2662265 RepID=UPI001C609559|nr:hypothetical protein [Cohnella sp. CFH 77786]MBW5449402.1 hypothetical protein [Cohnella sp. CFH 77786]
MIADYGAFLFASTGWITQFAVAFAGFAAILRFSVFRPSLGRWRISRRGWRTREVPAWFLKLWLAERESAALQERRVLLSGCGLRIDPRFYLACRRMSVFVSVTISVLAWGFHETGVVPLPGVWKGILAGAGVAGAVLFDGAALNALRHYRTDRIRRELIAVSSQLLYYTGSRLHLHGKLLRCLPLTRIIRSEMSLMLNEWYHDPDRALRIFKERLGTDEAYGFTESIRSLRLHESEEVYELLREMVREYKAKIDLAREGRKETASYVLFVLAGIPILYTFQIFLYPWVQEAARLFDALNP